jgi:FtsP/CotA-like multicopper oxidase with cupredoxin domain
MAGLVMGIRVTGEAVNSPAPAPGPTAQKFTLVMRKYPGYWRPEDAFGFSLESGNPEGEAPEAAVPGPLLVLHRNEPVEITLKNELPEATAIHWHGIELESYFDGVPGWSGSSASTTPAIEPGGTFVVRFTPPRAGTFMYHTHAHDTRQLASGLYGAIVVLEPGEQFDPGRDHVLLLGMEGTKDTAPQKYDRFPVVVNGSRTTQLTLKAGVANRLRLINITTNFGGLNVSLIGANEPIAWRWVAKDGADLPPTQQTVRPALAQQVSVGETYDFVVGPLPPGRMWVDVRRAGGEWVQQVPVRVVP